MPQIPVLRQIGGSTQAVAYTGTSAQSAALSGATNYVRMMSTTLCHVRIGTNPTATTSSMPLPPYAPEYFYINTSDKVAAIQNSSAGTLYITEMVT